jgi:tyramine---L-glutamate ligase
VLVYEFFAGGGSPAGELPRGLAAEALGMLWAVLTDFRNWNTVHTITALDPRFEERVPGLNRTTLPSDEVVCAPQEGGWEIYRALLKRCDAALIIAPETAGVLAALTAHAECAGVALLGSSSSAVTIAGNKASCHKVFRKARLRTPVTHSVKLPSVLRTAKKMNYPLVIKPVDGIGCEGVCFVESPTDLAAAVKTARRSTDNDQVVLQSFVPGTHVSASLLVAGNRCLPLSLNLQLIKAGSPFKYMGSQVPFDHPVGKLGVELACSAVRAIPGLSGYVGVDLVLSESAAYLIEVNPRLTTSYIGLRQVISMNLARAIWHACIESILPDQISVSDRVVIDKDDPYSWGYRQVNSEVM